MIGGRNLYSRLTLACCGTRRNKLPPVPNRTERVVMDRLTFFQPRVTCLTTVAQKHRARCPSRKSNQWMLSIVPLRKLFFPRARQEAISRIQQQTTATSRHPKGCVASVAVEWSVRQNECRTATLKMSQPEPFTGISDLSNLDQLPSSAQ